MPAFFVTGTGTDVGKTFVTQGLIRHLRSQGRIANAIKPIISGYDMQHADTSDTELLLTAMGKPTTPAEIDRISPWRFEAPLAPDMAAAREGRQVPFDEVVAHSRQAIAATPADEILLIEGVGGIMVPLVERLTVLDWMKALGVPVILVTGSYVGVISHTLAAAEVLSHHGLKVAVLAVSESPFSLAPLNETVAAMERFVNPIKVIAVPRRDDRQADAAAFGELAAALV
jgi:dethiobiotin synthetase